MPEQLSYLTSWSLVLASMAPVPSPVAASSPLERLRSAIDSAQSDHDMVLQSILANKQAAPLSRKDSQGPRLGKPRKVVGSLEPGD